MLESALRAVIDVPRRVWDPTEGVHHRHGERPLSLIRGVEVHWTGSGAQGDHGDTSTELLGFEQFHEVWKGWYDLFYQVGLDTEGNTYEGRDATIPSQSNLRGWLTLLVVVGPDDRLTPETLQIIRDGIARVWRAVDPTLNPATIRGHRERPASTSCPGFVLDVVNDLRANPPREDTAPMADTPFADPEAEAAYQTAVRLGFIGSTNRESNVTREQLGVVATRVYDRVIVDLGVKLERDVDNAVKNLAAKVAELEASRSSMAAEIVDLRQQLNAAQSSGTFPPAAGPLDVRIVGVGDQ